MTAIVVGIMMADGFDIPLSEIANTEGSGRAFINGWKITFWLAAALSAAGLITTLITKSTSPTKLPVFSNLDSIQQSVPETKIPTESSSSAVKPSTILISIPLVITLILALDWFWKKKSNRNE
ncbi:MAG TPA: hypothetical protein EYQ00_03430 [Dehalococcoidia bacterium]|nr:hypothetical protein [Dehalococcoidia bacterium]